METKIIAGIAAAAVVGVGIVIATVANHNRTSKLRDTVKQGFNSLSNRITKLRSEANLQPEQEIAQPAS